MRLRDHPHFRAFTEVSDVRGAAEIAINDLPTDQPGEIVELKFDDDANPTFRKIVTGAKNYLLSMFGFGQESLESKVVETQTADTTNNLRTNVQAYQERIHQTPDSRLSDPKIIIRARAP